MTNILLQPVEVVRDPYGYWVHPDIDKVLKTADEEFATKEELNLFKQQQNIETATTYFESDAPADLVKRYVDGEYDASEWNPTKPEGDGWFMLSIHDTEDMPVCVWARRKEPFIPVDLLNQFKHEMISHGYGSFYSFDTFENGNLKENSTKTLLVGWRVGHAERVKLKADIAQLQSTVEQLYSRIRDEDYRKLVSQARQHLINLGKEKIQQILLSAPDESANAYFPLTETYIRGRRPLTNPIQVGGINNHFVYEYWNSESQKWIEALAATGHEFNFVCSFKELQLAIAEPQEANQ